MLQQKTQPAPTQQSKPTEAPGLGKKPDALGLATKNYVDGAAAVKPKPAADGKAPEKDGAKNAPPAVADGPFDQFMQVHVRDWKYFDGVWGVYNPSGTKSIAQMNSFADLCGEYTRRGGDRTEFTKKFYLYLGKTPSQYVADPTYVETGKGEVQNNSLVGYENEVLNKLDRREFEIWAQYKKDQLTPAQSAFIDRHVMKPEYVKNYGMTVDKFFQLLESGYYHKGIGTDPAPVPNSDEKKKSKKKSK
jgi:hypothetical protein